MRHLQVKEYRSKQLSEEGLLLIRNIMGQIVADLPVRRPDFHRRGQVISSRKKGANS